MYHLYSIVKEIILTFLIPIGYDLLKKHQINITMKTL